MEQVAREIGQAIGPHLGEEDFVTAALAQIAPTGGLTIVNCGHHPPLLRHCGDLQPLTDSKPGLPLGLGDDLPADAAPNPVFCRRMSDRNMQQAPPILVLQVGPPCQNRHITTAGA